MNEDTQIAVTVVRDALANIVEFIEEASASTCGTDIVKLRGEARETVLALIAQLITVDGQLDPQESAFLRLLIDFEERPNAELAYLRQYSERWQQMDKKVPEFFRVAVESDAKNKTDTARGIMREIQFIGNNCAVTDTRFAGSEVTIIRRYLRFLEEYLDEKTGGAAAWLEP